MQYLVIAFADTHITDSPSPYTLQSIPIPTTNQPQMKVVSSLCCLHTDTCKCEYLGLSRNRNIKLAYIISIIVLILTVTIVSGFIGADPTHNHNCNYEQQWLQLACLKQEAMFRWLLGLVVMHAGVAAVLAMRGTAAKVANEGAWGIKLGVVVAVGLLGHLLPGWLLGGLALGAAYGVLGWYLCQTVIVVDLVYALDMGLKQLSQSHPRGVPLLKAVLATLTGLSAITINIVSYTLFPQDSPCLYIPITNSILLFLHLLLCLSNLVRGNTLLVYSLIMLYQNMLGFGLRYHAQEYPNTIFPSIQMGLVVVCLLSILTPGSNRIRTRKTSLNEALALNTSKQQQDNRYVSSNKWLIFHLVFAMVCYVMVWVINQQPLMLGSADDAGGHWLHVMKGFRVGEWVMVAVVHLWSIVAGRLFPERDFDELENYFKEFELN